MDDISKKIVEEINKTAFPLELRLAKVLKQRDYFIASTVSMSNT